MLARLLIRNYAIISELDISFAEGLTIITGETGAGKSILIGALSLVLGKRADPSALFDLQRKCVVEAHFNVNGKDLERFFEEHDLDFESTTIIRRELSANGRSRSFINDTPVNLDQLRELANVLIDIHSQHEVLSLKTNRFRTGFLDSCSDGGKLYTRFKDQYARWTVLRDRAKALEESKRKATADEDYIRFQLNELEELNLKEGEFEEAQARLSLLENAKEIGDAVTTVVQALNGSEDALIDRLRSLTAHLRSIERTFPLATEWLDRMRSDLIDLEDLAREMENTDVGADAEPMELQQLQERVDEILRLMTKHGKRTDTELIEYRHELEDSLEQIGTSDMELEKILKELKSARTTLEELADELTATRTATAKRLAPLITNELRTLGMPDAELEINIEAADLGVLGKDEVNIRFTANKGQALQDISKVASGGELSRLMLAVKAEMAKNAQLPSIIFDEIDTGVSGDVAHRVGNKIRSLSERMQVFCITHLPQIAAKATDHLYVFKESVGDRTETNVRRLTKDERILEVAKMLSSAEPTDSALAHANNLING